MSKAEPDHSRRLWIVFLSMCLLLLPIQVIGIVAQHHHAPFAYPLTIYGGFIVLVAIAQTLIAKRLFEMHGVQRFVFDIYAWFLVAGMLACPLALSNLLSNWAHHLNPKLTGDSLQNARWFSTISFYFMLLPIFFLTEAVMALASWFVRLCGKARST